MVTSGEETVTILIVGVTYTLSSKWCQCVSAIYTYI